MFRISIEIDNETRPEELVREAGAVTHFLKDVLEPYDDELHVGMNGKWGLGPIFKYQLALIEKAEDMLVGSATLKAVNS